MKAPGPVGEDLTPKVELDNNYLSSATMEPEGFTAHSRKREIRLTRADTIKPQRVKWLWKDRIPLGSLSLIAGREGIGKSTVVYALVADITRGKLPGEHYGVPKSVIIAATEDSWSHTIVPRLMAAGADLSRIYSASIATSIGVTGDLTLPDDVPELQALVAQNDVALIVCDPITSRVNAALDTHKDADSRRALEPFARLADETGAAVLGVIHVNKSASSDPLNAIMGSRAFVAVPRSVLFVMVDPDDEERRLLGQAKNNLGRTDLPTLVFTIEGEKVTDTDDGPVTVGKLKWEDQQHRSIGQAFQEAIDPSEVRTAVQEAVDWLQDYLQGHGGRAASADIKADGGRAGHSTSALKRAAKKLRLETVSEGFPRVTYWQSDQPSTPVGLTELTGPTEPTGSLGRVERELTTTSLPVSSVGPVGPVGPVEHAAADAGRVSGVKLQPFHWKPVRTGRPSRGTGPSPSAVRRIFSETRSVSPATTPDGHCTRIAA